MGDRLVRYVTDIFGKKIALDADEVITRPNFERMLSAISRAQILWDQGDATQARGILRSNIEHSTLTRVFAWRPRTVDGGRIVWLRHIFRREVRSWGSSMTRIEYMRAKPNPTMFPNPHSASSAPIPPETPPLS